MVWACMQGLRLFCDRLVTSAEQKWCSDLCNEVALRHFPSVSVTALEQPIMYSKWLSRHYSSADKEELRKHIQVACSWNVRRGREFREQRTLLRQ
jgi:dynein heavy chain 1